MNEIVDNFRLSYSSTQKVMTCERQYFLEKVEKAPRDTDCEEDSLAFRWGKMFHSTLENCKHSRQQFTMKILQDAAREQSLDQKDVFAVYAAVLSYFELHERSKLNMVACEVEIGGADIIGYVDVILADAQGNWWIVDLKTSAQIMPAMFPRLANDPQLNLYAVYKDDIAKLLGLNPDRFAGVRYRVVGKTRAVMKPTDTIESYAHRNMPKCYDIEVLARDMVIDSVKQVYADMLERVKKIRSGEVKPLPNYSKCFEWNRACIFWSRCYGKTYTECANSCAVFDNTTMTDRSCESDIFL